PAPTTIPAHIKGEVVMIRYSVLGLLMLVAGMASAGEPPRLPSLDAADEETESQDSWPSGRNVPTGIRANQGLPLPDVAGATVYTF
ncbi:MAG TPA: hypothetical protein DCQ09_09095, partial [Alcanivorax sp.]|nr:hypothetical protein [Alcanivorax sp.]